MDESLRRLSRCLTEAGNIVEQITSVESTGVAPTEAGAQTPRQNVISSSTPSSANRRAAMSSVSQAVDRARSMLNQSQLRGTCSRLNSRERLRAASTSVPSASKRAKQEFEKPFEFVLVKFPDEDSDGVPIDVDSWQLSDECITLRGFVTLKSEADESAVRKAIPEAIQLKYPNVTPRDLEFLKANRRKLTRPVNCREYSFQQIKLLAGQGCIYVKIKSGFNFVLDSSNDGTEDNNDDEFPVYSTAVRSEGVDERSKQTSPELATPIESRIQPEELDGEVIINSEDGLDKETEENIRESVNLCIKSCKDNNIQNPIEILKSAQQHIVQGRPLDTCSPSQPLEGETNFISINRYDVLKSAFEEIKAIENLRLTLEVSFYGEIAGDLGGPRREFFRLCLREIKEYYFDNGLRTLLADEYEQVGKILSLSILQNGPFPHFLSEQIVQELFFKEHPSPCVSQLRKGFCSLGLYQIGKNLPLFVQLMQPSNAPKLSRRKLVTLLHPCFSEEGSNARKYENEVYALFSKYVRETSSGRREGVTLGHILQFTTCADVEPMLGFKIPPSVCFYSAATSNKWAFLPTANTCSQTLNLPTGSHDIAIPSEEDLFEIYDHAFKNNYFGHV